MSKVFSQIEGQAEVFYIELDAISKVVRVSDKLEAVSEVPKDAKETTFNAAASQVFNASATSAGLSDGELLYQLASDLSMIG